MTSRVCFQSQCIAEKHLRDPPQDSNKFTMKWVSHSLAVKPESLAIAEPPHGGFFFGTFKLYEITVMARVMGGD